MIFPMLVTTRMTFPFVSNSVIQTLFVSFVVGISSVFKRLLSQPPHLTTLLQYP